MIVVTSCDRRYLPGVRALNNSIKRNAPGTTVVVLVYGDGDLIADVMEMGVDFIANPAFPEGTLLHRGDWSEIRQGEYAMPAMYSRLLIPSLFPSERRVFWMDADCIVLKPFAELNSVNMDDMPFAATEINWTAAIGDKKGTVSHAKGASIGTMLFDIPNWDAMSMTDRCVDAMNYPPDGSAMRFVCQTALNYAAHGKFLTLSPAYNHNVKRVEPPQGTKIIHWPAILPWDLKDNFKGGTGTGEMTTSIEKWWEPYR